MSLQQINDPQALYVCFGFPPWKRPYIKCFLGEHEVDVIFCRHLQHLTDVLSGNANAHVVLWGAMQSDELIGILRGYTSSIIRVEDGFLRSVGLGKYYVPPISLVFDRQGMYYDATQVSELEKILELADFDQPKLDRAKALIKQIRQFKISKYNVGGGNELAPLSLLCKQGELALRKLLLVPGQVEGDASLAKGSSEVKTDRELLVRVRKANPDAFILYKPHPDVVSGNQKNNALVDASLADFIVTQSDIHDCLDLVDEVHTITSLAGFEGLIRNKKVVTYGQPFYAGWGLTTDTLPLPPNRRMSVLTLEQLVAGVLIDYPRYYDYATDAFITVEQALETIWRQKQLSISRGADGGASVHRLKRFYIKAMNLIKSILYGLRK